jgi:heptosyltransferase-1
MTSQCQNQSSKLVQATKAQIAQTPKILLVKLSSLGDILNNLHIVWDLRKRLPNAQIDWIVE